MVDNDSTDGTGEIAAGYGVRVVRETARGVCQARQRGTVEARGEIVVSTDADTVQPRDWLTRIDEQFRCSEGIVAVAGPCRYENPSWWARLYPKVLFGAVDRVFAWTGRVLYVSATNTAFRRSAFPGYDSRLTQGGDELDLLRRLRHRGRVVWDSGNVVTTSDPAAAERPALQLLCHLPHLLSARLSAQPGVRAANPWAWPRFFDSSAALRTVVEPAAAAALRPRPGFSHADAPCRAPVPRCCGCLWPDRPRRLVILGLALFVPMWAGLARYVCVGADREPASGSGPAHEALAPGGRDRCRQPWLLDGFPAQLAGLWAVPVSG